MLIDAVSGLMADFMRLIDVSADCLRLKRGEESLHLKKQEAKSMQNGRWSKWGKFFFFFFTYSWSFFCLQLSFFAYSPLRRLLDALSHYKQKSSNCKQNS